MFAPESTTNCWRYYVSADYVDPVLRDDAAAQLATVDAIVTATDELVRLHVAATQQHAELQLHAGAQYAAGVVTERRKPTAADLAKRLCGLRDARQDLELQLQIVREAMRVTRARLQSLARQHSEHLLRWVAQQRETVGLAVCGDVMPAPVQDMWRLVDLDLDPRWHDQLQLPGGTLRPITNTRQLPLTWRASQPAPQRASLAWVWQELAAGNVRWVTVSAMHYPGVSVSSAARRCLQLTGEPLELPAVPPSLLAG